MSARKIVAIDDEPDILEVIRFNLARNGYEVLTARDGRNGLKTIRREKPDLVLLDLMLPELDGIEICRRLKGDPLTSQIPIIMITARGDESDVVLGLGLGADDYVTKPFSPNELAARVRAVLRRGPLQDEEGGAERLVRGDLVIDPARHEARAGDRRLELTATEFRLLHHLASHPGRVFTRQQLIDRIHDDASIVVDRVIDVHIRALRKKLKETRDCIETIRGVGYRFAIPGDDP